MKKICIMGLGYIGLPSAALLGSRGYIVHGVDINKKVVDTINSGKIHIVEPDLDTFVRAAVESGNLKASLEPKEADVFIIAVPTPFAENHVPDLTYVKDAAKKMAPYVKPGNIVILESTSPVGTTELVAKILKNNGVDINKCYIAHCPERVLPGRIMIELTENDRIVGGLTPEATEIVATFYQDFIVGEVLETDAATAELTKLVENSSRDIQIAFANELSMICDKYNLNVWDVIKLANKHPRVNILSPGVGVGGHCIAVDPWFIISANREESRLIETARRRNLEKTTWTIKKIKAKIEDYKLQNGKEPVCAFMGIAFKPNIDDLRESPALQIVKELYSQYKNSVVVEPNIEEHADFKIVKVDAACVSADLFFFLVAHNDFKNINIEEDRYIDFCGVTIK